MHRRLVAPLVAALLAVAVPHADAAERREPAGITVQTWGWGHGKGLSQYGAQNRATDGGQTYREIVEHYYPGTAWGTATGTLRVLLTGDTSDDVVVDPRSNLQVRSDGQGGPLVLPSTVNEKLVTRWRITGSGTDSVIWYRISRWKQWKTVPGDAAFSARGRPITLYTPDGPHQYRGALRSASTPAGRDTVNVLDLEVYVKGVIAREMPSYWAAEALKSQAIAARTYAAYERADAGARYYDLCDTSHCQVYGGVADEHAPTTLAVQATRGEIVTYDGEPAFTQFSASNGGYSAAGSFPYLVAEVDPYDHGYPNDPKTTTFTADQVTQHWTDLGDLVSVVTQEGPAGEHGGRVVSVTVTGTQSSHTISGSTFASWFGLRSTIFDVTAS